MGLFVGVINNAPAPSAHVASNQVWNIFVQPVKEEAQLSRIHVDEDVLQERVFWIVLIH